MSYGVLLEEISEADLLRECKRRLANRLAGLCDYCGRKPKTKPCKFPDRHRAPLANSRRKSVIK